MIARCQCGALKTVPPYMCAMEARWTCSEECARVRHVKDSPSTQGPPPKVEVEYVRNSRFVDKPLNRGRRG